MKTTSPFDGATKTLTDYLVSIGGTQVKRQSQASVIEGWRDEPDGVRFGKDTFVPRDIVNLVLRQAWEPRFIHSKDAEMEKFLDGVVGVVEASRAEHQFLWSEWHKKGWREVSTGLLPTIGELAGLPVTLHLSKAVVQDQLILFYESPSMISDNRIIDAWLEEHLPKSARRSDGYLNKTDAMNFSNVLRR